MEVLKILKTFLLRPRTRPRLFVKTKTKVKTLLFVVEAPRDQDFNLEDYITGSNYRYGWA